MRITWIGAFGLVLAGCAGATNGLPFQETAVRPAVRADAALPPARSETELTVRAFVTEGGAAREVAADCTLTSSYVGGSFRAPARLLVPDLGPQTPVLTVACAQGTQEGAVSARATLRRTSGFGGVPAVGLSVGTGYRHGAGVNLGGWWGGGWGWGRSGALLAVYPDVRVMMQ